MTYNEGTDFLLSNGRVPHIGLPGIRGILSPGSLSPLARAQAQLKRYSRGRWERNNYIFGSSGCRSAPSVQCKKGYDVNLADLARMEDSV